MRGAVAVIAGALVAALAPVASAAPPDLRRLLGVSCASVTSCLAVADRDVVGTSDGAATWTVLTPPPNAEQLQAISCVSARRCWVAGSGFGDQGAIYRTVDGGASWQHQSAGLLGGVFLSISCASALACVAGGSSGTIARTSDGGRSWAEQQLADASLINGIACISTSLCQAVGYSGSDGLVGVALRTTDSGAHWTTTALPHTLPFPEAVSCPSATHCVTVGMDTVNAGSTQLGRIAVTTDAGATWQRERVPRGGYSDLSGVSCASVDVCAAAGYGPRGVLGTSDGGTTWLPQGPVNVALRAVDCASMATCTAVGETKFGRALIVATSDGGATWVRRPITT